jgi:hypothetical protein
MAHHHRRPLPGPRYIHPPDAVASPARRKLRRPTPSTRRTETESRAWSPLVRFQAVAKADLLFVEILNFVAPTRFGMWHRAPHSRSPQASWQRGNQPLSIFVRSTFRGVARPGATTKFHRRQRSARENLKDGRSIHTTTSDCRSPRGFALGHDHQSLGVDHETLGRRPFRVVAVASANKWRELSGASSPEAAPIATNALLAHCQPEFRRRRISSCEGER